MKHYDMLFIHPSAQISSPQFIMMPMGMVSLMNELEEYDVLALNVGLELSLNKNFDLTTFLKNIAFDSVGIDLHWHEHTYSALEIAALCKEISPACSVVLGGMTATFFAEDILAFTNAVDVVVAGEAEETISLLLKSKKYASMPNLVYRDDGSIKKTEKRPVSSLDSYDFSHIENLYHWEEYLKCSIHGHSRTRFWYDFWLCTGRGCIYDCSYCGGGKTAYKNLFGRTGLTFRSVESVINDLLWLQDLGIHVVSFSTDIVLAGRTWWENLFSAMKREEIYVGLYLEVFQLPDGAFINALSSACEPRFSTVAVTLLSGCEDVRRRNGKFFSNEDYFKCVTHLEESNINHVPYFATGLPFETEETFEQTLNLTGKILSEFSPSFIFCTPLRLDPGSLMYDHPQEYGIIRHYKSFTDYYDRCRKREKGLPYDFTGYHTALLEGKQIMRMQHLWDSLVREHPTATGMYPLHFL